VLPDDTEASLAARVLAQEHALYPMALALAAGRSAEAADGAAFLRNPCASVVRGVSLMLP